MNHLAILLLLLMGHQTPLAGDEYKHQDQTAQLKTQKNQESQHTPPTVIHQESVNCEPCEQESQPTTSRDAGKPDTLVDRINAASTVVIAAFTILMFVIVLHQTHLTKNIERAWVLVEIGDVPAPPKNGLQIMWVTPRVKNQGNTPARIQSVSVRSRSVAALEKLPVPPDYAAPTFFEFVLAPRVEIRPMKVTFPSSELQNVSDRKSHLCIYGYVHYLDVAGKKRTTNFCFAYFVPLPGDVDSLGFFVASEMPAIYNRCT